jgi:hypothetical protein
MLPCINTDGNRRCGMWNYRLVKRVQRIGLEDFVTYGIHETYYNQKGEPNGITERPVEPYGENATEILLSWSQMAEAFTQPILDYDEFVNKDVEEVDDLEDLVSLKNITFKHDEKPITKKEMMRFKHEHAKERELAEIIYNSQCVGNSVEKVINFGQLLVEDSKNRTSKKK